MAEAGRPQGSAPLATDDVIGSLATRVRELSLRVAQLQGELDAARRRTALYEEFDAQVQDSLSAALLVSNQIRERARVTAEAIAVEARAQRPAATAELDAMRIERDALRRAIDGASTVPSRAAATSGPAFPMSEMRAAATEALRGVFKELVAEIRATTSVAPPAPAVAQAATPPRPDSSPSAPALHSAYQVPAVQPPFSPVPPLPAPLATAPPPQVDPLTPAPQRTPWVERTTPPAQPYNSPPSSYNVAEPMPRPTIVPPPTRPVPSAVVEDVDVAPAAAAPPPVPWVATPSEPVGEVQVVLSPISSFPRLVELERRLQGMPVVRTVYARDFRNGVATLAIGLRHPMTVDEFATSVTKLDYPRLRIVSTSGYVLELRIDTEASSIA